MINRDISALFLTAIVLSAIAILPAAAGQIERNYQAVMHVREVHANPVLDDNTHIVGIGAFRGLAIFSDGEIAVHRYEGWFDMTNGSGKFHGYASWRFDDGSEIRAEYEGTARAVSANDFEVEAPMRVVSGTGRFAGATGEGTFEGRRIEPIDQGGSTYLTGALTLNVPD